MIEEKIIDALNDIDDDMLEEVDRRRNPKWHRIKIIKQVATVAACFAFVAVGFFAVNSALHGLGGKSQMDASSSSKEDGNRIVEVDLGETNHDIIVVDSLGKNSSEHSTVSDNYLEAKYCFINDGYVTCLIESFEYDNKTITQWQEIHFNENLEVYYYNDKHELKKSTFGELSLEKNAIFKVYYDNIEVEDDILKDISVSKIVIMKQTNADDAQ